MKIIAVIPARYNSSRFQGKPLADICGKPMIWWVYHQVCKSKKIDEVWVATDDVRIEKCCLNYGLNCIMTSSNHPTSTQRVNEVAEEIESDYYIVINGDEPLIKPEVIEKIIPLELYDGIYVSNLMTRMNNPVEVIDSTNIKVVTDDDGFALFMSRSPIPYPKASLDYVYYKHVGVLLYTKKALEFFSETSKGKNELVEDVNELRFIEHGVKIKMIEVESESLSVDTPKDLEVVREIIKQKKKVG